MCVPSLQLNFSAYLQFGHQSLAIELPLINHLLQFPCLFVYIQVQHQKACFGLKVADIFSVHSLLAKMSHCGQFNIQRKLENTLTQLPGTQKTNETAFDKVLIMCQNIYQTAQLLGIKIVDKIFSKCGTSNNFQHYCFSLLNRHVLSSDFSEN